MSTLNIGTNVQISGTGQKITGVLGAPGIMPTGAVIYTASNSGAGTPVGSVPPGYLPCDGAAYSQTAYPELYAAIRNIFATGSYGTTLNNPATGSALAAPPTGQFRVPMLQGQFIRCWDGPSFTSYDPTPSGRIFGSFQDHAMQSHTHTYDRFQETGTGLRGGPSSVIYSNISTTSGAPSGNTATETRPRNIALFAIIKY